MAGARKAGTKRRGWGCALAAAAVVLLAVGGLAGARQVAVGRLTEVLHREVAPADRWEVNLGLAGVPRLLLRQPVSFQVVGTGVSLTDLPKLPTVTLDVDGLVYDLKTGQAASARGLALATVLSPEAVAEILRREVRSAAAFRNIAVAFEGQEVVLKGATDPADLNLNLPQIESFLSQLGPLQATVRATVSVVPPSTLALNPSDVQVSLPPGLNLGGAGPSITLGPTERSFLARDLRLDLRDDIPGITVQTATIEPAGLRLTATLDPQSWVGGARP